MTDVRWPTRGYVRLAAMFGSIGFLLGVLVWLVAPRQYESAGAVIRPGKADFSLPGALGAIGGEFGLGTERASESPNFIVSLLESRDVLTAVVLDSFRLNEDDANPMSLVEILTGDPPDLPMTIERARRKLRRNIVAGVNIRTDVISIGVEMRTPELARAVHYALLAHTDRANQRIQRTQARHRREFIESRLEIAHEQLEHAEDALSVFLERNIRFEQSPDLRAAERRLQRQVTGRQDLHSSLARDLEEVLQEEASDIASLSIVTEPSLPWIKSWPSGRNLSLAGTGVGLALATLFTFVALRGRTHETSLALDSPRAILGDVTGRIRSLYRTIA